MPKIIIQNLDQKEVLYEMMNKTVLQIIHENYLDWMHSCGAKGKCTTCKMILVSGGQTLSPLTSAELDYKEKGELLENERLACQAIPNGDLTILVPEESQLPHLNYTG